MIGFKTLADAQRVLAGIRAIEAQQRSPHEKSRHHPGFQGAALVEITGGPTSGLHPAKVVAWDDFASDYVDRGAVRFKEVAGVSLATGAICIGVFTGPTADGEYGIYEGLTSGSGERWMRVTATLPTADPGPYEGTGVELVGGAWQDVSPTVTYTDVYRAPSNIGPPKIPIGQRVQLVPSPTDPGSWEIAAVGGMQTVTFDVEQDWACETPAEVELTGRDLSVVVTAGGSDVKTLTFGPVVTDVSFDAETCELSVTYKNVVLNLCTLEGTFEDP